MICPRLALLLATPLLLSAAGPLTVAEREAAQALAEQRRLEAAAAASKNEAERAAAAREAAAQALIAAEARIAASEAALTAIGRQRSELEQQLAREQRPATALLAGLARAGRQPPLLLLAGGGAERQVRLAALIRHVRPEVDRRTAALRSRYLALAATAERQERLRQSLAGQQAAAAEARQRFAALEQSALKEAGSRGAEALAAGDRLLAQGEEVQRLRSDAAQRRAAATLAAELAQLPPALPRPGPPQTAAAAPPLAWSLLASGKITAGMGELLPNGIRSRGLAIAAATGTQVSAPADGRVVFAGPFRARRGVVIIDHGGRMSF